MIKQIFKISLIVTVISLVITLVMLPFGVRSMVDTANQWAEYASYEVEYQEPVGSVTQVNVKFTGLEWQSCGIEQQSSAKDIVLTSSGLQIYDITTTAETEGSVLNLTVDFKVKPEFERYASLARVANMLESDLKVPMGVSVTFDESSCRVSSYTTQSNLHYILNGFYSMPRNLWPRTA